MAELQLLLTAGLIRMARTAQVRLQELQSMRRAAADTHISTWRIGTTGASCLRTGLGTGLRPEVAQSNLSTPDTATVLLDRYQEKMGFS